MQTHLARTRSLLNKAQKMYDFLADTDDLTTTERDLMLAYLRDLYDVFLEDTRFVITLPETPVEVAAVPIVTPPPPPEPIPEPVQLPPPVQTEPTLIFETKVIADEPIIIAQSIVEIPETETPTVAESIYEPPAVPEIVIPIPPRKPLHTHSYDDDDMPHSTDNQLDDLFAVGKNAAGSSNRPIANLRTAFGINERIFSINELFGGSVGQFDMVIDTLNSCPDFTAAKAYLTEQIVEQYQWLQPNKIKKAQEFVRKVQLRFS